MKILKFISIGVIGLTFVLITIIFIRFWPIDPRLNGTYKSEKNATMSHLESTMELTEQQRHYFNQIFGHMRWVISGHKIKWIMESHTVDGYKDDTDEINEESSGESYYFVRMSNKDSAILVVLPSPVWQLNDIRILQIEFDVDGFWLQSDPQFINFEPPIKEKFTRMS